MPAWWTPDFTYWLLPAALIGVPVIAGGIFALAQVVADGLLALGQHARPEENAARGIAAGSIAYRVMAVFLVLAGIIEWAIGGSQALLARSLIADYPRRVLALVQCGAVARPRGEPLLWPRRVHVAPCSGATEIILAVGAHMNSILVADIAGVISFGGFILFFASWWRRMRVAWRKPFAKPKPTESAGELCGIAIGFLGLAVLIGNNVIDEVQRGAPLHLTFSLVTCATTVFVSGLSLGRLLERLAVRRQQRLGDGAAPNGQALQS